MTISLRLDAQLEARLRARLARDGSALSDFVRTAVVEKLEREVAMPDPYEAGRELFGRYSSGDPDASTNRKAKLREKLNAKHRRR